MKPLYVLLLVLAALAALLVALGGFRSNSGGGGLAPGPGTETTIPGLTGQAESGAELARTEEARGSGPGTPVESVKADRETVRDPAAAEFRNALIGTVIDPYKSPIANARVVLTAKTAESMFLAAGGDSKIPNRSAVTDEDGRYRFENVVALDHYSLIASHPEYSDRRVENVLVRAFGQSEEPPVVLDRGSIIHGSVRDVGGNAVPDASVSIFPATNFSVAIPTSGVRRARTDANGTFSMENVSAGLHSIVVKASGYGRLRKNGIQIQSSREIDLELTLKPAQMIGGRVVGPNDEPIAGATVIATSVRRRDTSQGLTKTDETGAFLFDDLNPGRYNVVAQHPHYKSDRPRRVQVGRLDELITLVSLGTVRGQVVDGNGKKIASGTVRLRTTTMNANSNAPTTPQRTMVPIRRGEFELLGVHGGDYVAEAMVDGFAPTYSAPFRVVPSQDVSGVVIRMKPGGSIVGKLVTSDGRPIAGARIESRDNTWTDDALMRAMGAQYPTDATFRSVRSDGKGRFRIENLHPDTYQLRISALNYSPVVRHDVIVSEASEQALGHIKLSTGGSIQGTVYDASGERLVSAEVDLVPVDPSAQSLRFSSKSNLEGVYRFERVPPGTYDLTGSRPAGPNASPLEQLFEKDLSKRQVTVRADETVKQDITIGG